MRETNAIRPGQSEGSDKTPPESRHFDGEIRFRISCRARTAEEVLEDLGHSLFQASAEARDPLIVLEDLGLLGDSIATLMKGVSRRLVGYPRTVTFWECSGYTEAFLSAMEGPQEQSRTEPV